MTWYLNEFCMVDVYQYLVPQAKIIFTNVSSHFFGNKAYDHIMRTPWIDV